MKAGADSGGLPSGVWWRNWLLLSLIAVLALSLIAGQLPVEMKKLGLFPLGVAALSGACIGWLASLTARQVGVPQGALIAARLRRLPLIFLLMVICLAHLSWVSYGKYRTASEERLQTRQAFARANANELASLLNIEPPKLSFGGYLHDRVRDTVLKQPPWPILFFGAETLLALGLGTWLACRLSESGSSEPIAGHDTTS